MAIGIPYVEALNMPLHIAIAFLSDERRLTPLRQESKPSTTRTPAQPQPQRSNTVTKSYISTERKHSTPKGKL